MDGTPFDLPPQAQQADPSKPAGRPGPVLVVDDNISLSRIFARLLLRRGHSVTCCSTMDDAVDAVGLRQYETILVRVCDRDGVLDELEALADACESGTRLVIGTTAPSPGIARWVRERGMQNLPWAPTAGDISRSTACCS